jgi:hypothetical protein
MKREMNGIISESASRSPSQGPKLITSIILGTCLFAGFTLGMGLSPISLSHLNPFRTETIRFDKISWISKDKATDFKIALSDDEINAQVISSSSAELEFKPFELKAGKQRRYSFNFQKHSRANFLKLERAFLAVTEAARYDVFEDYQFASTRMRSEFSIAMNESPANILGNAVAASALRAKDSIKMTASSAEVKGGVPVYTPATAGENPYHSAQNTSPNDLYNAEVAAAARTEPVDEAQEALIEVTAEEAAIHALKRTKPSPSHSHQHAKHLAPKGVKESLLSKAETDQQSPLTTVKPRQVNDEKASASVSIQTASVVTTQGTVVPYALKTDAKSENDDPIESVTSGDLSPSIQKKLSDTLLNAQLATQVAKNKGSQTDRLASAESTARARISTQKKILESETNDPDPIVKEPTTTYSSKASIIKVGSGACPTLDSHEFVRPNGLVKSTVDSQICPTKVTWLSKSKSNSGWIKVEGDDYFPTLTLHPAPNDGPTLLIDQNNLALIAIKSGVHITKGMGIIVGLVPDGYKVDFNGRAEETEYFESSGKNYFAILNAEPGAGIVEVVSKTNPNFNSFVFTPVLEDTISYLDLSAPVAQNITIKIVKSGQADDPEVAKLTVGLSTQSGIGAITRADGQATLHNVNLVPGFPVYVDVASRVEDNQSFTYRYQLKTPRRSGTYVLNQIAEKTIYHWLKQVKTGLSDQSAMVVGLYDRKKLDGFKNPHYTEVQALTAKFGLEPKNYTVLWNGQLSQSDPLEGDVPRFMAVQVPEGLSQVNLLNESRQVVSSELLPISPRVIHVISE